MAKKLKSVLTDDLDGFIVLLEPALHNMSGASVHSNPNIGLDLQLKQECQKYFERHCGSRGKSIEVFGKSYF